MKALLEAYNRNELWWAAVAIFAGAYFASRAITGNLWTISGWPRPHIAAAATGLAFGIMLLARLRGARWVGLAWLVSIGMTGIFDGFTLAWDFGAIAAIAFFPVLLFFFYLHFFCGDVGHERQGK